MKNQISSTLFRFTRLRSPDLITPASEELSYATIPKPLQTGVFFDAVSNIPVGGSKANALRAAASNFTALKTADDVRVIDPKLYDFSEWVVRNRSNYTSEELRTRVDGIIPLGDGADGDLQKVWNNLFYQLITQESFYTKEALMQMLIGDHLVRHYRDEPESDVHNNALMRAKVIIPEVLFDNYLQLSPDSAKGDGRPAPTLPDRAMKRNLRLIQARTYNRRLVKLSKALAQLQRDYFRGYEEAYSKSYAEYEIEIAPLINTYKRDLEAARQEFCAITGPEAHYNPKDPCQQPNAVPEPVLPKFDFTFESEIDPKRLQANLSTEDYGTLLEVLGYKFESSAEPKYLREDQPTPEELISRHHTYEGFFVEIDTEIGDNNTQTNNNTVLVNPVVNVGGVSTTVIDYPVLNSNEFVICGAKKGLQLLLTLRIALDGGTNILSIDVTQNNPDGSTDSYDISAPDTVQTGSILQLNGFLTYTFPLFSTTGPVFDFVLNLTDGSTKEISGIDSMVVRNACLSGMVAASSNPNPNPNPIFVPSGFGLKQVGVADYLKVEQSVHCYLEGEVSHIENIMAREYKEKSTRRLIRREETNTTSSETEREELTDTTTANRFEMQTEVDKVIQKDKSIAGFVNAGYKKNDFYVNGGLSFASNTSQESSTHQAQTTAQEITERALERIVTKVKEERVVKILEEFEENNKHGFDNRLGEHHVVGVYRWIDKLYKNQIYNYGKRMIFEFMVPDPAKLHLLGMKGAGSSGSGDDLTPPPDPRKALSVEDIIDGPNSVDETKASLWAGQLNAEISPPLERFIYISEAFGEHGEGGKFAQSGFHAGGANFSMEIPENYKALNVEGRFGFAFIPKGYENTQGILSIGDYTTSVVNLAAGDKRIFRTFTGGIEKKIGIGFYGIDVGGVSVSLIAKCERTDEYYKRWQHETFKAIMDAYYEALAEYERKKKEQDMFAAETKRTNPGFYRQIENTILRKNCISYIIDRNAGSQQTYGKDLSNSLDAFGTYEVNLNDTLDKTGTFVQFMEQAFEWDIMSYNFYPYYWGPRNSWADKYQFNESDDPIFRAFLQSGMARVIVTVRPGFEKAVQLYLTTGILWNGGEVPVMGDPLYLSIIDELEKPEGDKVGKAWVSRVPTSLTILQAKSIGLEVTEALPCNCDDTADFENPDDVPCSKNFKENDYKLGDVIPPTEEPVS